MMPCHLCPHHACNWFFAVLVLIPVCRVLLRCGGVCCYLLLLLLLYVCTQVSYRRRYTPSTYVVDVLVPIGGYRQFGKLSVPVPRGEAVAGEQRKLQLQKQQQQAEKKRR